MSILDRFTTIIKANVNAMLDKAEDPSKLVEQYIMDLSNDLAEVKKSTAGVMAESKRTQRLVEENQREIDKYTGLARTALEKGNEDDARQFLAKKQQLEAKAESLKQSYEVAKSNADKMRQMHDKLTSDINELKTRRAAIKAKVSVAKTQDRVNKIVGSTKNSDSAISAFNRMEEKADEMLDRATAEAELNEAPADPMKDLESKYAVEASSASVDAELEAMKVEMGLSK